MNIGDLVGLVEEVAGVVTKVPAIVTKVYNNAHGEIVADLHRLETTVSGVISKEENPSQAIPENGQHVTTDLSPVSATTTPAASAADAQTVSAEDAFAALSAEDQAAFLEKIGATKSTGDGQPS